MNPTNSDVHDMTGDPAEDSAFHSVRSDNRSSMPVSQDDKGKFSVPSQGTSTVEKSETRKSDDLVTSSEKSAARGEMRVRHKTELKFLKYMEDDGTLSKVAYERRKVSYGDSNEREQQVRFTGVAPQWETSAWYPVQDVYGSANTGRLSEDIKADSRFLKAAEVLTWNDRGKHTVIGDTKVEGVVSSTYLQGEQVEWKRLGAPTGMSNPHSAKGDRVRLRYTAGPQNEGTVELFTVDQLDILDREKEGAFYPEIIGTIYDTEQTMREAKERKASNKGGESKDSS